MKNAMCLFLLVSLELMVQNSFAGSATWNVNPGSGDWTTAANWTPAVVPNGPDDTATFDASNVTDLTQPFDIEVAKIVFNPGASAFTIRTARTLTINGAGVTNDSGIEQKFVCLADGGSINVVFHERASAGSATFISEGGFWTGGGTWFYDSSTAGNGTFLNRAGSGNGGATLFADLATAGNATLICDGGPVQGFVRFYGSSSAGDAMIILNGASAAGPDVGKVIFEDSSSGGNATMTANGGTVSEGAGGQILFWDGTSTAGNATLIAEPGTNGGTGGEILFGYDSLGGSARVQVYGTGVLNLSHHRTPGISIGSIEGDGGVLLGTNNLTVGTTNLDTTFAGTIRGGDGGSLTKIGSGKLSVSGASSYKGGTTLNGGILLVNNATGSGLGTGSVQAVSGILGGTGVISGPVTVGTGRGTGGTLGPGANSVLPGTLTIGKQLTLRSDATYLVTVKSSTPAADLIVANGIRIIGAQIVFNEVSSALLPPGTVLTVMNNTSSKPIRGVFADLADGGTVTIGNNTFQANYEGGDGNDLTLTVL